MVGDNLHHSALYQIHSHLVSAMRKLRLVLLVIMAWVVWQHGNSPATADGPKANLPLEIRPQQLLIPAIDLNAPVTPVGLGSVNIDGQEYPIWNTAKHNIGWHQGSGPPGQIGNTVLAGHSNGGDEIFRHLDELEVGADISIATNMGWHYYRVAEKIIVREQGEPYEVRLANARWILPTEDERLTLITCWPYPSNTHRLIIIAYPISQSLIAEPSDSPTPSTLLEQHPSSSYNPEIANAHPEKNLPLQRLIKNDRLKDLIN